MFFAIYAAEPEIRTDKKEDLPLTDSKTQPSFAEKFALGFAKAKFDIRLQTLILPMNQSNKHCIGEVFKQLKLAGEDQTFFDVVNRFFVGTLGANDKAGIIKAFYPLWCALKSPDIHSVLIDFVHTIVPAKLESIDNGNVRDVIIKTMNHWQDITDSNYTTVKPEFLAAVNKLEANNASQKLDLLNALVDAWGSGKNKDSIMTFVDMLNRFKVQYAELNAKEKTEALLGYFVSKKENEWKKLLHGVSALNLSHMKDLELFDDALCDLTEKQFECLLETYPTVPNGKTLDFRVWGNYVRYTLKILQSDDQCTKFNTSVKNIQSYFEGDGAREYKVSVLKHINGLPEFLNDYDRYRDSSDVLELPEKEMEEDEYVAWIKCIAMEFAQEMTDNNASRSDRTEMSRLLSLIFNNCKPLRLHRVRLTLPGNDRRHWWIFERDYLPAGLLVRE